MLKGKKKKEKEICLKQRKKIGKTHGIGLKNIKEKVEKNKGIFSWESTAGEFGVKVILPLRARG